MPGSLLISMVKAEIKDCLAELLICIDGEGSLVRYVGEDHNAYTPTIHRIRFPGSA